MDLFDTLTWAEILGKITFLGTPTLTVPLPSCGGSEIDFQVADGIRGTSHYSRLSSGQGILAI
jgi:hypothetical protein